MSDKTPLKFDYDDTTPSSLAEFTAGNTVPLLNGGTGVSSLALLGAALSSIDLSATWVSAGNITATNVSATTVSATHIISEKGVSSLNVSASNQITARKLLALGNSEALTLSALQVFAESGVSSTTLSSTYVIAAEEVSATTVSATYMVADGGVSATSVSAAGGFVPQPYAWGNCADAGTASDTEQNVGKGSTVTAKQTSTDDFEWDHTNARWDVKKYGTYEITANVILTVAATTIVTLQIYVTFPGASSYTADTKIHSTIDPTATTITYVGTIAAGGYAYVTTTDDGATDVTVQTGTTITVKRLG